MRNTQRTGKTAEHLGAGTEWVLRLSREQNKCVRHRTGQLRPRRPRRSSAGAWVCWAGNSTGGQKCSFRDPWGGVLAT